MVSLSGLGVQWNLAEVGSSIADVGRWWYRTSTGFVTEAVRGAGRLIAAGGRLAWRGARWIGGKIWQGVSWVGAQTWGALKAGYAGLKWIWNTWPLAPVRAAWSSLWGGIRTVAATAYRTVAPLYRGVARAGRAAQRGIVAGARWLHQAGIAGVRYTGRKASQIIRPDPYYRLGAPRRATGPRLTEYRHTRKLGVVEATAYGLVKSTRLERATALAWVTGTERLLA